MLKHALTAALILAAGAASVQAAEPVYWRQRVFFIPYQPAAQDRLTTPIDKVQLLVARDGVGEWAVLQEAEPRVRGFSYHAPVDGEYSFALRTSDRNGNLTPAVIAQPQLRVVVDTTAPTLEIAANLDATGRIVVRYEARDQQLKPETMRLEVQAAGATWQRVATGPPELSQPNRVVGQLAWKPPASAGGVSWRGSIEDRAGNQVTAAAEASLVAPLLQPAFGPTLLPAGGAAPPLASTSDPAATSRSGVEWPTNPPAQQPATNSPQAQNSYTSAASSPAAPIAPPLWPQQRTPAQLVADVGGAPSLLSANKPPAASNPFNPPPLFDGPPPLAPSPLAPSPPIGAAPNQGWGPPISSEPAATGPRWVNSLTFDVDYELHTVGPWGVSKVELWATRDEGREWVTFGADPDNRGPMRVTVPAAGVYGFRLVVNGANGAAASTPAPGEAPELVIGVDLEQPHAELQAAEIGQGNLADHLLIRWSAVDENLEPRPVGLFFSAEPDGPWFTIATDLENNGQYAWRLLRQVPEKLYLRLEIRDKAGNVAVRQSPAPVVLNLPQPSGRLRSVRPVEADPSRYRTAAGQPHLAPGK